jgi:hypothetical protein
LIDSDNNTASYDALTVKVDKPDMAVKICDLPRSAPAEWRDRMALSDVHAVISDEEPPTRPRAEYADSPTLWPTTVTLIAPVVATFVGDTLEISTWYVMAEVSVVVSELHSPTPTETRTWAPESAPTATLQCNDDDEIHVDDAPADPPTRLPCVMSWEPVNPPTKVTLIDPVAAAFVPYVDDTVATSYENRSDDVKNCCATVTAANLLPAQTEAPATDLATRVLSDDQRVVVAADPPRRMSLEPG